MTIDLKKTDVIIIGLGAVVGVAVPGVKTVHDHLVWIEPNCGFVIQSEEDEARAPHSVIRPAACTEAARPIAKQVPVRPAN